MLFLKDCLFIISILILTTSLGLPFLHFISPDRFKYRYLILPTLGYGFIGFLATVAYVYGLNQHILYVLIWCLSVSIILQSLALKISKSGFFSLSFRLSHVGFFFLWFLAFLITYLPYKIGGLQFSTFAGWIWDQYAYVGQALAYHRHSAAELIHGDAFSYLLDPIQIFGATEFGRRPTVSILFSFFSEVQHHEMYRWGYLYLLSFISYAVLAMTFLITNLFNASLLRSLIISIAIFVGFWGQVYIDFNAWAMLSSIALLLVITTFVLVAIREMGTHNPFKFLELFPLTCLIGFSFYFYPENTIFQLVALFAVLMISNLIKLRRVTLKYDFFPSCKLILAIIIGGSLSLICRNQTLGFLLFAMHFASANIMTRAVYGEYIMPLFGQANWLSPLLDNAVAYSHHVSQTENQYLVLSYIFNYIFKQGHLGILYDAFVDGFYGFLGMYFITPLASIPSAVQDLWREILLAFEVLFILTNIKWYIKAADRHRTFYLLVMVLVLMVISFLFKANIFSLARGIFYIAPYFLVLFFIPFIETPNLRLYRNFLFIMMIFAQFAFGIVRIIMVSIHHYPIYPLPYTFARSHYFIEGQTHYDWDLSRFDVPIKKCKRIYINVTNQWQEHAIAFYLYSKNKEFVKKYPVNTSVWAADPIGYQTFNGLEDCELTTKQKIVNNNIQFNELELIPYMLDNNKER